MWRNSEKCLTCVVFGLQVHVAQLVNISDVHLLFINLWLVEILKKEIKWSSGYFYCKNATLHILSWQKIEWRVRLTSRLTVQPIFLFSVSSPFMQSLPTQETGSLIRHAHWCHTHWPYMGHMMRLHTNMIKNFSKFKIRLEFGWFLCYLQNNFDLICS